jgi:hypothetical protein
MKPVYIKGAAIVLGIGCFVAAYFLRSDATAAVALAGMGTALFAYVKTAPGDVTP